MQLQSKDTVANLSSSFNKCSMEDLSLGTIQSCLRSILDITNCPVCLETVKLEAVQCVNEHVLCKDCKVDLTECPTCRQPFSEIKPARVISQIIEALPKQCKHKNCGTFLEPGEDHEKFCDFQELECKECFLLIPGQNLLKHLMENHDYFKILSGHGALRILAYDHLNYYRKCFIFKIDKYFIWMETTNIPDSEKFYKRFELVPIGKPKHDIFVKLSFYSDKSQFSCRRKLDPDLNKEKNTIHVPWDLLPDFINTDKKLCFTVDIDLCLKA